MNKPKIFISSTYVDLARTREHVSKFISDEGFQPVTFERGGVYFDFTKPLDESCYDQVAESDIFVLIIGGRYGSPASGESRPRVGNFKTYNSVTKREYDTARRLGIPIYVFVDSNVMSEYKVYLEDNRNMRRKYTHVDSPHVFRLIDSVYSKSKNNYTTDFRDLEDITVTLKAQWTGMLSAYIRDKKKLASSNAEKCEAYINGYKLFYYRSSQHLSFGALANLSTIDRDRIRQLEKINGRFRQQDARRFACCSKDEIKLLERALGCGRELAFKDDGEDFISQIMEYYKLYKGKEVKTFINPISPLFQTKAVFFDFDGTLTNNSSKLTSWEKLWVALGYTVNDCAKYHSQFSKDIISHQEWCDVTTKCFRERGMRESLLDDVAKEIYLLQGAEELIRYLNQKGVRIYIISGSIRQIIKYVLGSLWELFDDVKSNNMIFESEELVNIVGTKFDFSGKAKFIRDTLKEHGFAPTDALFVGNSCNDIYASRSGVRTLCVNPHFTSGHDVRHWSNCIAEMKDCREILDYLKLG